MLATLPTSSASATTGGTVTYASQNLTGGSGIDLGGITCVSSGNCVAVGVAAGSPYGALIDTLSNGSWTATNLNNQGFIYPELTGIWCASMTSCIAVGGQGPLGGSVTGDTPLVETLNAGSWSGNISDLAPSDAVNATFTSISCVNITTCVAAGSYSDSSGDTHALFDALSGSTWTQMTPSDPDGANSLQIEALRCFSLTSCVAVGSWGSNGTSTDGLAETLSGSTWTVTKLPAGEDLRGLSCASSTSCLAVGSNGTITTSLAGITETLSGSTWTTGTVAGAGDGGTANGLAGVSCPTSLTSCVAIGSWRPPNSGTDPDTLIETLSAGTWTPQVLTNNGNLYPSSISCPTLTSCVGAGQASIAGSGGPASVPAVVTGLTHGYWLVGSDGGIFNFGSATFQGSTGNLKLNRPVVGITPTLSDNGYWLVASDGGIFAFNAPFVGSLPGLGFAPAGTTGGKHLNAPIVAMVPAPSGAGYFMVASDGGVFAFNAKFAGSCPALAGGCSGTAVGVAPDHSGNGYWLVTATGHVYSFGDAPTLGSPGPQSSNITSIVRTHDGNGYWILDANGTVFAYGDATSFGSLPAGATSASDPATAVFATSDGGGYWVSTAKGKVYDFGDAPSDGDMSATNLNGPIIAATGY
ncbi:MAG TPA: hypothetical protein VGH31_05445 [Acidimicrobiales bacterium]